jgi:hypothetical protein
VAAPDYDGSMAAALDDLGPLFATLPALPAEQVAAIEAIALGANDRYLSAFIEAQGFCPFARSGRDAGQTRRYVYYADRPDLEPLLALMAQIAADPRAVVAQVIVPLIDVDPDRWIDACARLTALGHARIGGPPVLACAALHPRLRYATETPYAMVPLFRRAPDPTIQWVRLDGLATLYAGRDAADRYLEVTDLRAFLRDAPPPRPSLYARVAETNAKMARRLGLAHIEATLAGYAAEARARYAQVLLRDTEPPPRPSACSQHRGAR